MAPPASENPKRLNANIMGTNPYTPMIMEYDRVWWREVVIYEIYVQSFQDSNNDGIGDLPGIVQRLDYLKRLGVDMLWLTPIYESPLEDQGYDISNYKAINPLFGTMKDWEHLAQEVHKRGMKLMMDMVFNHTSSQVSLWDPPLSRWRFSPLVSFL
jgi:oligo-1,6-glucosidase/alpha-glucosidase